MSEAATLYFEDFEPGRVFDLGVSTVEEQQMLDFATAFDPQWYHVDRDRAQASSWGGLIASGWFTASLCMRRYVDEVLSRAAADTSPGMEELRWFAPVHAGDRLRMMLTVVSAVDSSRGPTLGTVVLRWEVFSDNEDPALVMRMQGRGWFRRRPS